MGLRARIVLFVVAILLVGQVGWGFVASDIRADELRRGAISHGEDVLMALAAPCGPPLATRKPEMLDTVLAAFAGERSWGSLDLEEIAIIDAEGVIAGHTDPRRFGTLATDPFSLLAVKAPRSVSHQTRDARGSRLSLSMPIVAGLRWGTATAVVSLNRLDARVARLRLEMLLSSLILSGLLGAALYALLSTVALRPLEELTNVARRLAGGQLDARAATPARRDEIALLARTFNEMAARIQSTTRGLEEQVATRTQALEDAVAELELLARTDGLTGLENHRSLQERLAREVARAQRYGHPLSVLMIDVDHFKAYNDAHGHPAGDRILVGISAVLRSSLRTNDAPARYGGEEFAVLLPATEAEAARRVAEKLLEAVRSCPFPNGETQPKGRITVSIGGATLRPDDADGAAVLARADEALYRAKGAGRDRFDAEVGTT